MIQELVSLVIVRLVEGGGKVVLNILESFLHRTALLRNVETSDGMGRHCGMRIGRYGERLLVVPFEVVVCCEDMVDVYIHKLVKSIHPAIPLPFLYNIPIVCLSS